MQIKVKSIKIYKYIHSYHIYYIYGIKNKSVVAYKLIIVQKIIIF